MHRSLAIVRSLTIALLLLLPAPAHAQQQPPPAARPAAQDGFVPVDSPINPNDAMPAPRLVAIAYAFIWVVFFGYLVSLRSRLSKVEREIEIVSRRAGSGGRSS
jgi:CcmD family protein